MATDVDVQYFSHLNGLALGDNWGDMIRLLDACLVNGLPLTSITSAIIDAQGDITLNLYAKHNCLLFQIVELSGFAPAEINGKYRIKGAPTSTQLVLKAKHVGKSITTVGSAKLASLGYEIAYRDTYDVKRVYRAIDPTAAHPYIRVDETISDGTNSYNSSYAKYAMVGLIEDMTHIDDYEDTDKLQLPLDTANFTKNWKIVGTGTSVLRGWSRWYWAHNDNFASGSHADSSTPSVSNNFCLAGDRDAFYFLHGVNSGNAKILYGCGLFNNVLGVSVVPNWFLQTSLKDVAAGTNFQVTNSTGFAPLAIDANRSAFFVTRYDELSRLSNHDIARPIIANYLTGLSNTLTGSTVAPIEIPFSSKNHLMGSLKHVFYSYRALSSYTTPTPLIASNSMYLASSLMVVDNATNGGVYFYLGELE